MEVHSPYQYPTLHSEQEIRLIVLKPGSIKETSSGISIECTLIRESLANKPSFLALSYRWGDTTKPRQLLINDGQTLQVTESLWLALCYILADTSDLIPLDSTVKPQYLWVDAICINQDDDKEKNHQVSIMGKIFGRAEGVAVWLGVGSELADLAMETLELVEETADCDWDSLWRHNQDRCDALGRLLKNEYFSRMWIVQEVVLARCLTIYYGSKSVSWTKLSYLREHLKTISPSLWISWIQHERIPNSLAMSLDLNRLAWKGRNTRLVSLLEACQECECSDPRDKVYSLLGVASDCQNNELQVNYDKTLFEVYGDVISLLYKHRESDPTVSHTIVRFSQMLQKSFTKSLQKGKIATIAIKLNQEANTLNPSVSSNKLCVTGIWGGKVSKLGPSFKLIDNPAISKVSSTASAKSYDYRHIFILESIGGVKLIACESSFANVHHREPSTLRTGLEQIRRSLSRSKLKLGGPNTNEYEEIRSTIKDVEFCFFETATSCMGIGPQQIAPDDVICQFSDCDVAAVLRQEKKHLFDRWQVIGRAIIFNKLEGGGLKASFKDCAHEAFRLGVAKSPSRPPVSDVISFYDQHERGIEGSHISGKELDISLHLDIYTLHELTRYHEYDVNSILVS